ncbi:MAG: monovalent cation/H(+) antiporter subunit G [Pseudomonadota bacterium]
MSLAALFTVVFTSAGLFFFIAGAVGMIRFPDMHSRLHALTKADNLGLGLIVIGVMPQVDRPVTALKLVFIWALALVASAVTAQLLARSAAPPDLCEDG